MEQRTKETNPDAPSAIGSAKKASSALWVKRGRRKVRGKRRTAFRFKENQMEYLACPIPVNPSTKVYWKVRRMIGAMYQWMYLALWEMTSSMFTPPPEKERNSRAKGSAKKRERTRQAEVKAKPQAVICSSAFFTKSTFLAP